MISSPEEARLLLNKWRSTSVRVLVFVSNSPSPPADFMVRLEGLVTGIAPEGTILVESDENFIMFRLSDANYQESVEISANLDQLFAHQKKKWKAALCFNHAHSTVLFCTEEESATRN
jgi:hypothetical protein